MIDSRSDFLSRRKLLDMIKYTDTEEETASGVYLPEAEYSDPVRFDAKCSVCNQYICKTDSYCSSCGRSLIERPVE